MKPEDRLVVSLETVERALIVVESDALWLSKEGNDRSEITEAVEAAEEMRSKCRSLISRLSGEES